MGRSDLLRRWGLANTAGEVLGLGGTGLLGWVVVGRAGEPSVVSAVLAGFAVAVLSGVVEATVVGLLQHRALVPWVPRLTRRAWWWATLWGALTAYVLGYLPSTVMSLVAVETGEPVTEPPQWVVLLAAAGLGLVAGAVLAWAQALVLRHHVDRAGRWVPANMLAWAVGMPLVLLGMDLAFGGGGGGPRTVGVVVATLGATGAVVGVINGSFLTRMVLPRVAA